MEPAALGTTGGVSAKGSFTKHFKDVAALRFLFCKIITSLSFSYVVEENLMEMLCGRLNKGGSGVGGGGEYEKS